MSQVALPQLSGYKRKLQTLLNDIDTLERQLHPEPSEKKTQSFVVDKKIKMFKAIQDREKALTPFISRFPKPFKEKIGPGYYNSQSPTLEPGCVFGSAPRFPENLYERISTYHARKVGSIDRERDFTRIRAVTKQDLSLFKPQARLENIKLRANLLLVREQLTKEAKEAIFNHEIGQRLLKIRIKENKLELRLRKDEVTEVSKSWLTLAAIVGTAYAGYRIALSRKQLHLRSNSRKRFLLVMAISVGKVLVWVRRYRARESIKKLQPLGRYARCWVDRRKHKFAGLVVGIVESSLTHTLLTRILLNWRSSLIRLQRAMRRCLLSKKTLYCRLGKKWDEACFSRSQPVPSPIKIIFMRKAIKDRLKGLKDNIEIWKNTCSAISSQNPTAVLPPRPHPDLSFSKEELTIIDSNAKLRSNRWEYMIYSDRRVVRVNR